MMLVQVADYLPAIQCWRVLGTDGLVYTLRGTVLPRREDGSFAFAPGDWLEVTWGDGGVTVRACDPPPEVDMTKGLLR